MAGKTQGLLTSETSTPGMGIPREERVERLLQGGVRPEQLEGRSIVDYEEAERTRFLKDALREFYGRGRERDFFGDQAPTEPVLRERTRRGLREGIEILLEDTGGGKGSVYQLINDEFAFAAIESGRHFAAGVAHQLAQLPVPKGVTEYAVYMAGQYANFLLAVSIMTDMISICHSCSSGYFFIAR